MGKNRQTASQGKMAGGRVLKLRFLLLQTAVSFGISGAVAGLFYNSPWGMCSLPASFYLTGAVLQKHRQKKALGRLNLEFKDYMYAVSGALCAGYSIERAFLTGLQDIRQLYGEDSLLAEQLDAMEQRLGIKEPIEHILSDFAKKSGSEDIENFVEIFCYAKRGGGDFIHIIATTISRICDKIEVSEEIHTVMAEKALEQKIMCAVPLGILLFFRATSPEFIGRLYGNLLGIGIMSAALLLYGAAWFLGMKIVEIEV